MTDTESPCVDVIGMGMSPRDMTAIHLRMIDEAQILVGGRRHLEAFPDVAARRIEITHDLKRIADVIDREMDTRRIVVLASGDPLYFGIGAYLIRMLGRKRVRVWPNINTLAAAFARIGRPWHDAAVVSLHGRDNDHGLLESMDRRAWLAVFTVDRHLPDWIAEV
ncbi:MAG: precorrin-6y C5,15-methyltransferase (decarboxylating) subunit CbiE, partial [Desulfosarcina sp.]|nr:precorrin-6y C5,15-methyltransferase (decarboxylating) subunit CbiE [Desulfobacterales bacterium]